MVFIQSRNSSHFFFATSLFQHDPSALWILQSVMVCGHLPAAHSSKFAIDFRSCTIVECRRQIGMCTFFRRILISSFLVAIWSTFNVVHSIFLFIFMLHNCSTNNTPFSPSHIHAQCTYWLCWSHSYDIPWKIQNEFSKQCEYYCSVCVPCSRSKQQCTRCVRYVHENIWECGFALGSATRTNIFRFEKYCTRIHEILAFFHSFCSSRWENKFVHFVRVNGTAKEIIKNLLCAHFLPFFWTSNCIQRCATLISSNFLVSLSTLI